MIDHVEYSPMGYYNDKDRVRQVAKGLDRFPTWSLGNERMPLERIAKLSKCEGQWDVFVNDSEVGFAGFCNLLKS